MKLKKTIYIGLGGTGVAALLKIKKCFMESYNEIPPMIGFLAIDTDGGATGKAETDNKGRKITLAPNELLVCTVKSALQVYQANPQTYDWVPNHNVTNLQNIQGGGAGQIRSNGRFIAYYNNQQLQKYIQALANKVNAMIPSDSKFAVDTNANGVEFPVNVNVFASVAGGTGSGMLIDVILLIKNALQGIDQEHRLYPWIVLPEVFRAMNSGPSMNNVLYNAYGALRELDYLMHHDPQTPPIDLGHTKVGETPFDVAYLINNTNQTGTTFSQLDDIMEIVARCAFLPANEMGDAVVSPFDNIINQIQAHTYDIINKRAWAASAGSAELLYDSQALATATACRVMCLMCNDMTQGHAQGDVEANNFVDDQDVMIRENNGRDDVIDAMLSPTPGYQLQVDDNTSETDIDNYIDDQSNENTNGLSQNLKNRLDQKLANTKQHLDLYLKRIMKQGNVQDALDFISSLKNLIGVCQGEMQNEITDFHTTNSTPIQWDYMLAQVPARGIIAVMKGKKYNEEEAANVENMIREAVTNRREELRRQWAIRFYTSLTTHIDGIESQLTILKSNILAIGEQSKNALLAAQNNAQSKSELQVYLHDEDMMKVSAIFMDDGLRAAFYQYIGENGTYHWSGWDSKNIKNKLWGFASTCTLTQEAQGRDIDSVIKSMPPADVKKKLERLKLLASPLWTYNPQGYNNTNLNMDKTIVVGVGNRVQSCLVTDPAYQAFFDEGPFKATYASTYQSDRIYLLIIEDTLPIYAVNGFSAYKADHDAKTRDGNTMDNFLDKKLESRMLAEKFDVLPTLKSSNTLELWVYGIIFGYIHFDEATQQYWIKSIERGDSIRGFRYDLGAQRDVAYNNFSASGLDKEVEESINLEIGKNGRAPIDEKIEKVKADGNYYPDLCQMSTSEISNIDNPKYVEIRKLIDKEIRFIS